MGFEITDGTGKGTSAAVDINNRLLTNAISESVLQFAAELGDAFFIGSPLTTLTSDSPSAVIFIENRENKPLILSQFFITAESTSGGSPNMFRVSWYKNPTTITSSTASTALNQNFGSSSELDANILVGSEGSSVTGGSLVAQLSFPIGEVNVIDANLILEKGSSFAITIQPPSGNTSSTVQFGTRSIRYTKTY